MKTPLPFGVLSILLVSSAIEAADDTIYSYRPDPAYEESIRREQAEYERIIEKIGDTPLPHQDEPVVTVPIPPSGISTYTREGVVTDRVICTRGAMGGMFCAGD